jgi:DNA polymerase-3 subunit delta'
MVNAAYIPAAPAPSFDELVGQPMVARFLSAAVAAGTVSHATLLCGPTGAGKTEAALLLARAALCAQGGGADDCDDCLRMKHGTHPDLHVIAPAGVAGYVGEQIHELIHDVSLAPMRAKRKVYLITRADLLNGTSANALLKTLEEPPASVVFILMARTREAVLPTIASRCQVLAFNSIPEGEAIRLLVEKARVDAADARIALAVTGGSVQRAADFLLSEARRNVRLKVLAIMEHLAEADDLEVLDAVRELCLLLAVPLDAVAAEQAVQLEAGKDYLTKGALTQMEQAHKRELTSRKREAMEEALNVMRSWLRDVLMEHLGCAGDVVNIDHRYNIEKTAARLNEPVLVRSLQAVSVAAERMQYNVLQELALEAMLYTIRGELSKCQL